MPFVDVLLEPLFFLWDPGKRLFFVYLLSSAALALGVLSFQSHSIKIGIKKLLDARVWVHPSTKIDISLFVFNVFLRSFLFLFVTMSSIGVAKVVAKFFYRLFPDFAGSALSYQNMMILYAVISFLVLDFFRFFQHYLFHKIPFLWSFHKVHHAAEVMTPLTLYRTHPIESIVSAIRRILVTGLISGFFIFYSQSVIGGLAILGVNAFDFLFNFFGSNLRHSHVWLSFGPLNHIFVSPAQHQIHHSRAKKHMDKNLGFAMSIWDKLFGTFYPVTNKKEFIIYGVRGEHYKSFWDALKAPFSGTKSLFR